MTVVGARPQFIKAAAVSRAIAAHNAAGKGPGISEEIVHTGQHYDHNMSQCFFEEMDIPEPAVNLGVGSGPQGRTTGAMLAGLEDEIKARGPDLVLVYGDTNSTLAGALAAVKLGVPVAHVEAGLRSFNRKMPEETNRVVADHVSALLFCPSDRSLRQLAAEGITRGARVVGDVMYDAVLFYRDKAQPPEREGFALATVHRAENTDDPARLADVIAMIERCPIPVLLAAHPRTRKALTEHDIPVRPPVEMVEPLPYLAMLGHLQRCDFVITDSGGLQKEAYFFGKKCLTLRTETEWVELVEDGANRLMSDPTAATGEAYGWARQPLEGTREIYGRGDAADLIAACLAQSAI